jgi:hypothetical protein
LPGLPGRLLGLGLVDHLGAAWHLCSGLDVSFVCFAIYEGLAQDSMLTDELEPVLRRQNTSFADLQFEFSRQVIMRRSLVAI